LWISRRSAISESREAELDVPIAASLTASFAATITVGGEGSGGVVLASLSVSSKASWNDATTIGVPRGTSARSPLRRRSPARVPFRD
jgi:hypothetical protein